MTPINDLEELAVRLEDFAGRIESIANSNMTASGQTSALALLASLKGHRLALDCAQALRAIYLAMRKASQA